MLIKLECLLILGQSGANSDCQQTESRSVDFPGFTPQAQDGINAFAGGLGTPQSEDCLTLNIWAPALHMNPTEQPVLFFFHGGSRQFIIPATIAISNMDDQGFLLATLTPRSIMAVALPKRQERSLSH